MYPERSIFVRKQISYLKKIEAVQAVLNNQASISAVSKDFSVAKSSLRDWIRKYQKWGVNGIRPYKIVRNYPPQIKHDAVIDVVKNGLLISEVLQKYDISDRLVLRNWIRLYNERKQWKPKRLGLSSMKSGRSTSFTERIEIVEYTLKKGRDYQAAIQKYGVSYQQIYNWLKKYENSGAEGLKDGRGHHKKKQELTELERLKLENVRLKNRNQYLEMEADIAKKEVELRQRFGYFR